MPYGNAGYWITGYAEGDLGIGIDVEPLQIVEIVQPKCSRTFGVSPCLASGPRCYNTDKTCGYLPALDMTDSVSIFFGPNAANRSLPSGAFQVSEAIPALQSVTTAPTVLNVGAGDESISPLGLRAVASVQIADFPHNDYGLDPYLDTRDFDPLTRGTFWSKWLARNPFYVGNILRVYDGFYGDALSDMTMREYSIEKFTRSRNSVSITAKDVLRKITDTRALAPAPSAGYLAADITVTATSFSVAGAVLDDYPSSGRVRIGNEVLRYTSRSLSGSNINFSGVTRGQLGTVAAAANQFDTVQRVLSYVNEPFHDIIYDLLTVEGGISPSYITKADWDSEFNTFRSAYVFTGYITEPVEIQQLIGELSQQSLSNIWWDERTRKIILKAQRPDEFASVISDNANIVADSYSMDESTDKRASQVFIYYGLRNPTLSISDNASYRSVTQIVDVEKERQYGETAVKQIFCRWVSGEIVAREIGTTYLNRFKDKRTQIVFELAASDAGDIWTGSSIAIRHFMDTDVFGEVNQGQWLVTSAEVIDGGFKYRFTAEDNGSAGILWKWVSDDTIGDTTLLGCWTDENGTDGAGNDILQRWL